MAEKDVSAMLATPNAEKVYSVTWRDLPLSCPTPAMSLWNSHPRVYLPIQESGLVQCPYCGAVYILADPALPEQEIAQPNIEIENLHHQAIEHDRCRAT